MRSQKKFGLDENIKSSPLGASDAELIGAIDWLSWGITAKSVLLKTSRGCSVNPQDIHESFDALVRLSPGATYPYR